MNAAVGEFVKAADVIAMAVARHCYDWLARKFREVCTQACEPKSSVDEKLPVAPFDEPHVGAKIRLDSMFPYSGHTVWQMLGGKPIDRIMVTEHGSSLLPATAPDMQNPRANPLRGGG